MTDPKSVKYCQAIQSAPFFDLAYSSSSVLSERIIYLVVSSARKYVGRYALSVWDGYLPRLPKRVNVFT
jgi:hypothetical protein